MKSTLLILLLNLSSYNSDISIIRELYLAAPNSESNCTNFGQKLNNLEDSLSILIRGYKGCFNFIKCKFTTNPIHKFIYFNKGKNLLESAIKEDPESVELKLLRYSIQRNIPSFLFYKDNIEKDFDFVCKNINQIKEKEVQKFITNTLKSINK
jgi:hypothetical protein